LQELDVGLLHRAVLEACGGFGCRALGCVLVVCLQIDVPHGGPAKYGMDVVLLDTRCILASRQPLVDDTNSVSGASEVHFAARVGVQHEHVHNKLRALLHSELSFFFGCVRSYFLVHRQGRVGGHQQRELIQRWQLRGSQRQEKTHHVAHAIDDEIGLCDAQEGLARDFARAAVVAENLHDAHAGIDVDLAAAGALFLGLVHFRADCTLFDLAVDGACVADIDGARHGKGVAFRVACDGAVADKHHMRGLVHDGNHKAGHHDAPHAVFLATYSGVLFPLGYLMHSRSAAQSRKPCRDIGILLLADALFVVGAALETVGVDGLSPPHGHRTDTPAHVLTLLRQAVLIAALCTIFQDMHVEDGIRTHNLQRLGRVCERYDARHVLNVFVDNVAEFLRVPGPLHRAPSMRIRAVDSQHVTTRPMVFW